MTPAEFDKWLSRTAKEQVDYNDPFFADLPPMTNEHNQADTDAEQARRFREAAQRQRDMKG